MTPRQLLAQEFVLTWRAICASYGRRTYADFRVRAARRRYLIACANG